MSFLLKLCCKRPQKSGDSGKITTTKVVPVIAMEHIDATPSKTIRGTSPPLVERTPVETMEAPRAPTPMFQRRLSSTANPAAAAAAGNKRGSREMTRVG
ncbi:hypothetical protein AAVH_37066 [Aphelenchoides avenae]|nr:hypothetical protein AAVH_37066 [Aphelenchus avenae]